MLIMSKEVALEQLLEKISLANDKNPKKWVTSYSLRINKNIEKQHNEYAHCPLSFAAETLCGSRFKTRYYSTSHWRKAARKLLEDQLPQKVDSSERSKALRNVDNAAKIIISAADCVKFQSSLSGQRTKKTRKELINILT